MVDQNQEAIVRASLIVDGFNLYYPLHELKQNHYKWLDLWRLGEWVCKDRSHTLMSVTYCTAYPKNRPERLTRHQQYVAALRYRGVEVKFGHYIAQAGDPCSNCGTKDERWSEKQTDINVAMTAFEQAMSGNFDAIYILSADSDQAATFRHINKHFSDVTLVTVAPPNRPVSTSNYQFAGQKRELNELDIQKSLFPPIILGNGFSIRCPVEYEPPK